MTQTRKGKQAVVIGGSMAGLVTARVLADHFDQVILVEKDDTPDESKPRKGVPQGHHLHGLLAQGRTVLETYYPGISAELMADGAVSGDMGEVVRWYHFGAYKKRFTSGLMALMMSRPLLEMHVRRRTAQLPNVRFRTGTVRELLTDGGRRCVTGVRVTSAGPADPTDSVAADLVVDAGGRGSASGRWLTALGYAEPRPKTVKIGLSYTTRVYRRNADPAGQTGVIAVYPQPPHDKRAGAVFAVEGGRWMVTLVGILGERCPKDEAGFVEYARSLCAPDIYDLVRQSEPMSDAVLYNFPTGLRRRYERLTAFPERYVVVGDAVCSFNPVFGQGMTSAILQAQTLDHCLWKHRTLDGLWKPYFRAIAKVVDTPWLAATSEDFRYPDVQGQRPPGLALLHRYVEAVHRTTHRDTVVYRTFLEVLNLMRPPLALLQPGIVWRVLRDVLRHQQRRHDHPEHVEQFSTEAPAAADR